MNLLVSQVQKRKEYLEKLMSEIEKQLKNMPQGKLRISKNQGIPRYYQITEAKDTRGTYIRKDNIQLANDLAQKEYLNKMKIEIQSELQDINTYLRKHSHQNLEEQFLNQNNYRQKLIKPLVMPDELFAQQWEKESFETNPYETELKVYITKKGEKVRSKSEVFLADMYYELGIPYRYEAALTLKSGKIKYPDFTLLNKKTREIIYHEHLGLMDDELYRRRNFRKLDDYRRNGIYPGKNLIVTFESEKSFLNIREITEMIQEIFEI